MIFLRKTVSLCIILYQNILSPDTGMVRLCGFSKGFVCGSSPSCSEFTRRQILARGIVKGFFSGIKRVARCHPFSA